MWICRWRTARIFHRAHGNGNVHGPGPRVGSPKVAQLATIARRHCLPHDCHFKCAIMAAGLGKKNAILRNSSRGCLVGRAFRLGFTHLLSLCLSPSAFHPPALRRRSRSQVCALQGPADADRRWAFHRGPAGYGSRPHRGPPLPLRLPPAPSRVFLLPLFHARLLPFFFSKHFYLPPCRPSFPRPPPSPLCFGLTRLPLPTSLFSVFLFPLSALLLLLLLFLALPTTPVEKIHVYSTLFLLHLDSENERVVCIATLFSSSARDVDVLDFSTHLAPGELYISMRSFVINDYSRRNNQHKSREWWWFWRGELAMRRTLFTSSRVHVERIMRISLLLVPWRSAWPDSAYS